MGLSETQIDRALQRLRDDNEHAVYLALERAAWGAVRKQFADHERCAGCKESPRDYEGWRAVMRRIRKHSNGNVYCCACWPREKP